jgi:hypothetical protein
MTADSETLFVSLNVGRYSWVYALAPIFGGAIAGYVFKIFNSHYDFSNNDQLLKSNYKYMEESDEEEQEIKEKPQKQKETSLAAMERNETVIRHV